MLFRQIIAAVLVSLGMWSCASGTSKEAVEAAEKDVFAVHDEVMPQIGTILKLNKQLRHRADSLDSLEATDASVTVRIDEEKAQAIRLNRQLNEADSLMMGWMEGYNGDTVQQLKPDAALGYLKEQKTKIDDVKQKISSSIEQAQSYLKSTGEQAENLSNTHGALIAFDNVGALQNALSKNGIGVLKEWRKDETGWVSGTNYFSFGPTSQITGTNNNLAYYLESDSENHVDELKLVLNIFNEERKTQAIDTYRDVIVKTFSSISMETPKGLISNLTNLKEFESSNKKFSVSLELSKSRIDTWKLTIKRQ